MVGLIYGEVFRLRILITVNARFSDLHIKGLSSKREINQELVHIYIVEVLAKATSGGLLWKLTVLKIFAIFTGKHLRWCFFSDLQACNFIKKRLQHRCFPVNIGTFLRTPIFKNICDRLLLYLTNTWIIEHYTRF